MKLTITRHTENPIGAIAEAASICWNSTPKDKICDHVIETNHNRCLEFADITVIIEGVSAKVIREIYTHIAGTSRLQASTRYINYDNFDYIIPESIKNNISTMSIYTCYMENAKSTYEILLQNDIPKEDASFVLPLGYESKMILKINLSSLINMAKKRKCKRAFWEFRQFMDALDVELKKIDGWDYLTKYLKPQCEWLGYCPEKNGCGKTFKKSINNHLQIEK